MGVCGHVGEEGGTTTCADCKLRESEPWQETWTFKPESDNYLGTSDGEHIAYDVQTEERGRLASAAPDMARVLLDVEWEGADCAASPMCPTCCVMKYPEEGRKHAPDCTLDAALRKAGVR